MKICNELTVPHDLAVTLYFRGGKSDVAPGVWPSLLLLAMSYGWRSANANVCTGSEAESLVGTIRRAARKVPLQKFWRHFDAPSLHAPSKLSPTATWAGCRDLLYSLCSKIAQGGAFVVHPRETLTPGEEGIFPDVRDSAFPRRFESWN